MYHLFVSIWSLSPLLSMFALSNSKTYILTFCLFWNLYLIFFSTSTYVYSYFAYSKTSILSSFLFQSLFYNCFLYLNHAFAVWFYFATFISCCLCQIIIFMCALPDLCQSCVNITFVCNDMSLTVVLIYAYQHFLYHPRILYMHHRTQYSWNYSADSIQPRNWVNKG